MFHKKLYATLAMLALTCGVTFAATITNGTFDAWTGTSTAGSITTGTATGWVNGTSVLPIEYTYGSGNVGALIRSGTTSSTLTLGTGITQAGLAAGTAYSLSFDVGLSNGSSGDRLFQLYLTDGSGKVPINLIAQQVTGGAKFQVYNSDSAQGTVGWHDLQSSTAAPVVQTATGYDIATATFTGLTMYHVVINVSNMNSAAGLSYTVSFGLAGDTYTPLFTSDAMSYVYNASGASSGLDKLSFFGTWGGASTERDSFLVDNVALSAVPEPTALALMTGGVLLLGGGMIRRRR